MSIKVVRKKSPSPTRGGGVRREDIIARAADHVRAKLEGEGTGHDWWHIRRVWKTAVAIGKREKADLFIVELAALLHDIADWKFHGGDLSAGPRAARAWLESLGAEPAAIDRVCAVINEVTFKGAGVPTPTSSLEAKVVQDADRLDALGAIGIGRAFAYGGAKGRLMHDPNEKPRLHASFEAYKKSRGTTINHFHEKLLLLKERMNTAAGRRMAAQRHKFMESFLKEFMKEWDSDA